MSTLTQRCPDPVLVEARVDIDDRFNCKSNSEVLENFRHTAHKYDDTIECIGYVGPRKIADALDGLGLDKTGISILDAAAGTGNVGLELSKRGYTKMDAVDGSAEMLQQAKKHGIYTEIMCHDMNSPPMPIKDNTYDVAVCSAAFMENYLAMTAMDDIIRVVRPGGYVIEASSVEEWAHTVFYPYLAKLEEQRLFQQVSRTFFSKFMDERDGCLKVYRVL